MIPVVNNGLKLDFIIESQPSKTYALDIKNQKVNGYIDGLSAMEQAVFKILNTNRYENLIYSWNYGIELSDLFGQPTEFVYPEIKRRITEALIQDDRITGIDGFEFSKVKRAVTVSFVVHTIVGSINAYKVVEI